mmetsp:Transcript_66827/g.153190  ORF Transcript_66827/g.153190 Transcript_66827/m.153190 type:complete len:372 (+) Transcript_66827:1360-2475(+)
MLSLASACSTLIRALARSKSREALSKAFCRSQTFCSNAWISSTWACVCGAKVVIDARRAPTALEWCCHSRFFRRGFPVVLAGSSSSSSSSLSVKTSTGARITLLVPVATSSPRPAAEPPRLASDAASVPEAEFSDSAVRRIRGSPDSAGADTWDSDPVAECSRLAPPLGFAGGCGCSDASNSLVFVRAEDKLNPLILVVALLNLATADGEDALGVGSPCLGVGSAGCAASSALRGPLDSEKGWTFVGALFVAEGTTTVVRTGASTCGGAPPGKASQSHNAWWTKCKTAIGGSASSGLTLSAPLAVIRSTATWIRCWRASWSRSSLSSFRWTFFRCVWVFHVRATPMAHLCSRFRAIIPALSSLPLATSLKT